MGAILECYFTRPPEISPPTQTITGGRLKVCSPGLPELGDDEKTLNRRLFQVFAIRPEFLKVDQRDRQFDDRRSCKKPFA
jgi:hypothetical protein